MGKRCRVPNPAPLSLSDQRKGEKENHPGGSHMVDSRGTSLLFGRPGNISTARGLLLLKSGSCYII